MQAVFGTLETYSSRQQAKSSDFLTEALTWVAGIFGCSHRDLSRPFSRQGETYRVCLGCGARRTFDQDTWNMRGKFYYKPARTSDLREVEVSALRAV